MKQFTTEGGVVPWLRVVERSSISSSVGGGSISRVGSSRVRCGRIGRLAVACSGVRSRVVASSSIRSGVVVLRLIVAGCSIGRRVVRSCSGVRSLRLTVGGSSVRRGSVRRLSLVTEQFRQFDQIWNISAKRTFDSPALSVFRFSVSRRSVRGAVLAGRSLAPVRRVASSSRVVGHLSGRVATGSRVGRAVVAVSVGRARLEDAGVGDAQSGQHHTRQQNRQSCVKRRISRVNGSLSSNRYAN